MTSIYPPPAMYKGTTLEIKSKWKEEREREEKGNIQGKNVKGPLIASVELTLSYNAVSLWVNIR